MEASSFIVGMTMDTFGASTADDSGAGLKGIADVQRWASLGRPNILYPTYPMSAAPSRTIDQNVACWRNICTGR